MFVILRHSFFLHLYLVSLDLPYIVNTTHTSGAAMTFDSVLWGDDNSKGARNLEAGSLRAEQSKVKYVYEKAFDVVLTEKQPGPRVSKASNINPQQHATQASKLQHGISNSTQSWLFCFFICTCVHGRGVGPRPGPSHPRSRAVCKTF